MLLVTAGADVNAPGDQQATPLFNAIIGGTVELIAYLLRVGADIDRKNAYNRKAIEYAQNIGASTAIVTALKKHSSPRKTGR